MPVLVSVRVHDVHNIWGFRRAVYATVEGRGYAAVFDEWDNCLGGSCEAVEALVSALRSCTLLASRESTTVSPGYAVERRVELVYRCDDEAYGRVRRLALRGRDRH